MSRQTRGPLSAALFILFCVLLSLCLLGGFYQPRMADLMSPLKALNYQAGTTIPQKHRRVVVASKFEHHHDVYMSIASSLARAMNRSSIGTLEVYAQEPFLHEFQAVVDRLGLYSGRYRNPDDLLSDVRRHSVVDIDMIVFGTCEIDLRLDWMKDLLSIWDERGEDNKFEVVCIVHNVMDIGWQSAITEWSRRNAIRIVTISEHVADSFREEFRVLADSPDDIIRSAGYENILVDTHPPVLALPDLPERSLSRILSKAVIQGSFDTSRRDYNKIFKELNASLHDNPAAWGYQPIGDQESFIPDTSLPDSPFQLFAIGSGNKLDIPKELNNVVEVQIDLSYSGFYDAMSSMDICIPAFAGNGYYHDQASSTFSMAVECNVPLLVTQRMRGAYVYVDDDRAVVTRPAAMREIAALKALRTGDASSFLETNIPHTQSTVGSSFPIRKAVDEMLSDGWTRSLKDKENYKRELWRRNDRLAEKLLQGIHIH